MSKPKKQPAPRVYDDSRQPRVILRDVWLNSPLSITRFWGRCTYNGADYEVDELTEDLCREDVAKERRAAYTKEDLATIKAKYLKDE